MSDERLTLDEGTVPIARSAIRHSPEVDKILPAMLLAQKGIQHAVKDAENPHFRSSYASLNAVIDATKPHYNEHSIVIIQGAAASGPSVTVTTMLAHESGQWFENDIAMEAKDGSPQAIGSCMTYGRRYGLGAMASLGAEDDDGNAAQGKGKPAEKQTGTKKQAPPDPPAADRVKALKAFHAAWDEVIAEVEDGDEVDAKRRLEHYFLYAKEGDRAVSFDAKHDYMRPLKAEQIDKLTDILRHKKADVVGWLESDDVRESVGLPKVSVETCAGCAAILSPADKEKSDMVKLPKGYCEACRPDATVAMMKKKREGTAASESTGVPA